MKRLLLLTLTFLSMSAVVSAAVTIDTVPVGDPGNIGQSSGETAGGFGPDRVCGSVRYTYNIGKYEVTAGEYAAFLNAVAATDTYQLYNEKMARTDIGCGITRKGTPGRYTYWVAMHLIDRPVNYVSFWDACRFVNWLHNGQPSGKQDNSTTERGAYNLNGFNYNGGRWIKRQAGAKWALPTEDEWHKAAYYKGGGTNAGYWKYPTKSDIGPGRDMSDLSGNNANVYPHSGKFKSIDKGKRITAVGEFQNSESPYGTFDQGGNVWEWNEAVIGKNGQMDGDIRGQRGGAYNSNVTSFSGDLASSNRYYDDDCGIPTFESDTIGFRVVSFPDGFRSPSASLKSTVLLLAASVFVVSLIGFVALRRRR